METDACLMKTDPCLMKTDACLMDTDRASCTGRGHPSRLGQERGTRTTPSWMTDTARRPSWV